MSSPRHMRGKGSELRVLVQGAVTLTNIQRFTETVRFLCISNRDVI